MLHALRSADLSTDVLDLSANFITEISNVQYLDNVGLQLVWLGASADGEIFVECSNDYELDRNVGTWTRLDFGSPILVGSSAINNNHMVNISQIPFANVRVRFAAGGASSGTMKITITSKQIG